jgi:hypothetical protein
VLPFLSRVGAEARATERIVHSGKIITAAGVSAGIDMALYLAGQIAGRECAEAIQLLTEYDSYYYSRGRQTPLPILRVKFAAADRTWIYVDPDVSQVVARIHKLDRVERWIYNGLHSLDFGFWYDRRPLWDIGVIALSLGALVTTTIGFWLGLKRLRRGLA